MHAVDQRPALPADGTVAGTDVIQVGVNLEPDTIAVTGACIGFLHDDVPVIASRPALAFREA